MAGLQIARSIASLREYTRAFRKAGETIALVPTMGALHEGHLALVQAARSRADRVIVTIFVNPSQFAPDEDLSKYPRTEEADIAGLRREKADLLFSPPAKEIYPEGFATTVTVGGPAEAGLEDRFRPTHFAGVATIVAKLFCQSGADFAFFGEKDYQQLMVVTRMARDLDLPVEVVGLPTIREEDGLAMSSRNRFLSATDRATAPLIHRTLRQIAGQLGTGHPPESSLASGRHALEAAGFAIDYLELRDATALAPVATVRQKSCRLLAAARLGQTRLIDNIAVNLP